MTPHVTEHLPELALGILRGDRAAVEEHVASCPACAAELAAQRDSLMALGASLSPIAPSQAVRDRLLTETSGRLRFSPFTDRVANLFALDPAEAAVSLERIVGDDAWMEGPIPGFFLSPVVCGPSIEGSGMFLRVMPGTHFPKHEHLGEESLLVMQGLFREGNGQVAAPGDWVIRENGTVHEFDIPEGPICVCAYRILGGITLL